jgi:hypothetical protein
MFETTVKKLAEDLEEIQATAWAKRARVDDGLEAIKNSIEWYELSEKARFGLSYGKLSDGSWQGTVSISYGVPDEWKTPLLRVVYDLAGAKIPPEMAGNCVLFKWKHEEKEAVLLH